MVATFALLKLQPKVPQPPSTQAFCEPKAVDEGVAHAIEPLADERPMYVLPTFAKRGSGTPRDVHVKVTVSPGKNVVGVTENLM